MSGQKAGDYLLRMWGGAIAEAVAAVGGMIEEDPGEGTYVRWFQTRAERRAAIERAELAIQAAPAERRGIAYSRYSGPHVHLRTRAHVTLSKDGKSYSYVRDFGYGFPPKTARFIYEEGNWACDDNRSLDIRQYCDPSFPEHGCGDTITLDALDIRREPV